MKSFVTIAISLLLVVNSTIAQERDKKSVAVREDIERAEQLADRFVQRFRETLDFEVVYREFFIIDPEKRLLNSASLVLDSERQEELKKKLTPSETEQAYVSFMNLYYLVGLYVSNILTAEEEDDGSKIKAEELFPPELLRAVKEPAICFFFVDYLEDKSCAESPELFQTAEDVRQFIKNANHLAALLRKYMPPEPFNSPKHKAYTRQLEWDGRETSVSEGDEHFRVGEETMVYEIYRELSVLNVVEENGEMKVVGIPLGN